MKVETNISFVDLRKRYPSNLEPQKSQVRTQASEIRGYEADFTAASKEVCFRGSTLLVRIEDVPPPAYNISVPVFFAV